MDPNATLAAFFKALREGDKEAATEAHANLTEWLKRGGFQPTTWSRSKVRRFHRFDPATGQLSKVSP